MEATTDTGDAGTAGYASETKTTPADRRAHERFRLPMELRWEGLSGRHSARLYDLSLSGCYVETLGQVQAGEQIRFEVQSPAGGWVQLQGEVVHAQTHMGFGLHFLDLSEEQARAVAELIGHARAASGPTADNQTYLQAA